MFIPPTPGPIAAASTLGIGNNLLLLMGLGALCSVFPLITGYLWANKIGKTIQAKDEASRAELSKTYEELVAEYGKLPSGFSALAPIIVPIILMALSSIVSMAKMSGAFADLLKFLGTPIIALAVGTIFAILQMQGAGKIKEFYAVTEDTLKTVGPILFVTAAGGVLGKVISSSDMVNKTAQGSSTVALTTTAGIVAPLLPVLGFTTPAQITLVTLAIGAGAMTVSHANDSYFWVVTNFGEMTPEQGYKAETVNTLIMGIASILEIFLLSLFLH